MDLLSTGIYTVSEAAKLLGVANARVNGWVFGYPKTKSDPIIKSDLEILDGEKAMTFVNLMEARFIAAFARHGVSVKAMRSMAKNAQEILDSPHPFATDAIFKTDGRKIVLMASKESGDKRMYDLQTKNWALYEILVDGLKNEVIYNEGRARLWRPRKEIAPNVVLDPIKAFGQPVLEKSGVPTRTLFDAFNAEDETYESVASWYDVPVKEVKEAVKFEFDLAKVA